MSGSVALSNYVLGYIQIPLKEFLDIPFKKELQQMICNSSFTVPSYAKLLGRVQQQPLSKFRGQQPLT